MKHALFSIAVLSLVASLAAHAHAMESSPADQTRTDPQTATHEAAPLPWERGAVPDGSAAAGLGVRLTEMEEQISQLRGALEENQHAMQKIQQDMKLLSEDMEYRLQALEQSAASQPSPAPVAPATTPEPVQPRESPKFEISVKPGQAPKQPASGGDPIVAAAEASPRTPALSPALPGPEEAEATSLPSASPKEQYNYGFTLMNQAQYAKAGDVFNDFIKKYPKDPLVGNVYYWLGETYYVREEYLRAADSFRQGFEAMPSGVKAPDNLLKLSKSLAMLAKKDQACVVLKQLLIKFEGGSESVLEKARTERDSLQCPK